MDSACTHIVAIGLSEIQTRKLTFKHSSYTSRCVELAREYVVSNSLFFIERDALQWTIQVSTMKGLDNDGMKR